jgi:hypothetical protein
MTGASFKPVLAVIAGVGAAIALISLYRGAGGEAASAPDDEHAAHEASLSERSASPDARPGDSPRGTPTSAPSAPSRSERDLAWQTELRDASESFRNSTLLIAIRENDFACDEVTSAEQGSEPLGGWRVTCRGALVYLVAVGASGQLVVEPIPMGDGLIVFPGLRQNPSESFPPEPLRNQPLIPPDR